MFKEKFYTDLHQDVAELEAILRGHGNPEDLQSVVDDISAHLGEVQEILDCEED